jgi:hypothetical protein
MPSLTYAELAKVATNHPPGMRRGGRPAMPTIDLTDAEHAALTALIRPAIEDDRFPRAPRVDVLRPALAKLDTAAAGALRRPPSPQQPKTPKGRPPAS